MLGRRGAVEMDRLLNDPRVDIHVGDGRIHPDWPIDRIGEEAVREAFHADAAKWFG